MFLRTKIFVSASLLSIISGFIFIWLGLKPAPPEEVMPAKTPPSVATASATFGIEGERVLVTEVIDGDTVKVENGKTVRLLGVDTPETKDPRKSVQCFGKEASNELKRLIDKKYVILEKDISETDKYNRLLRYIYLPLDNGQVLFIQDYLVREGFATALTFPPDVKFSEQLREAEKFAKEQKKGLWGRC